MQNDLALQTIQKIKMLASEMSQTLLNSKESTATKQTFFLDNQKIIKEAMYRLDLIVTDEALDAETKKVSAALKQLMEDCIKQLHTECMINEEVSEQDLRISVNEETIASAVKTNQATKQIVEQQTRKATEAYLLIQGGNPIMIHANKKEQLEQILASRQVSVDDELYRLTPVKLNVKTIVTVG